MTPPPAGGGDGSGGNGGSGGGDGSGGAGGSRRVATGDRDLIDTMWVIGIVKRRRTRCILGSALWVY